MVSKLAKLEQCLSALCAPEGSNVALWFSAGSDSRLLLEVLLSEKVPFSILRFDDGWSREQRKTVDALILKYNLRVYSYPPISGILLGNGQGELTLACHYSVGLRGENTAIFRDLVPGEKCAFDINIPISDRISPPMLFDTHLVGTKRGETHWIANGRPLATQKRWFIGGAKFFSPIFEWNDADVLQALKDMKVDYIPPATEQEDLGNLVSCSRCLTSKTDVLCPKTGDTIPPVQWSPLQSLRDYREHNGIATNGS
jgi:hypothetical protein